ncbi:MAG: hypothetical protein PBV00_11515 [Pseudomonas asiatica]
MSPKIVNFPSGIAYQLRLKERADAEQLELLRRQLAEMQAAYTAYMDEALRQIKEMKDESKRTVEDAIRRASKDSKKPE